MIKTEIQLKITEHLVGRPISGGFTYGGFTYRYILRIFVIIIMLGLMVLSFMRIIAMI